MHFGGCGLFLEGLCGREDDGRHGAKAVQICLQCRVEAGLGSILERLRSLFCLEARFQRILRNHDLPHGLVAYVFGMGRGQSAVARANVSRWVVSGDPQSQFWLTFRADLQS